MNSYTDQPHGQETVTVRLIKFGDTFEDYRESCAAAKAIEPSAGLRAYTGLRASDSDQPAGQFRSQIQLAAVSHFHKADQTATAARETLVKLGPGLADDLARAGQGHHADLIRRLARHLTRRTGRKAAFALWPAIQGAILKATTVQPESIPQAARKAEAVEKKAAKARGRMSAEDAKARQMDMLARLQANPDLRFDASRLAELINVHRTTASRWLKKLAIKAKGAGRHSPDDQPE